MKKYSHENTLWEKIRRAETKEFIRKRIYYLCLILFSLCIIIGIGYTENWNRQQQSSEELRQEKNEAVVEVGDDNEKLADSKDAEVEEIKTDIPPLAILSDYQKPCEFALMIKIKLTTLK